MSETRPEIVFERHEAALVDEGERARWARQCVEILAADATARTHTVASGDALVQASRSFGKIRVLDCLVRREALVEDSRRRPDFELLVGPEPTHEDVERARELLAHPDALSANLAEAFAQKRLDGMRSAYELDHTEGTNVGIRVLPNKILASIRFDDGDSRGGAPGRWLFEDGRWSRTSGDGLERLVARDPKVEDAWERLLDAAMELGELLGASVPAKQA